MPFLISFPDEHQIINHSCNISGKPLVDMHRGNKPGARGRFSFDPTSLLASLDEGLIAQLIRIKRRKTTAHMNCAGEESCAHPLTSSHQQVSTLSSYFCQQQQHCPRRCRWGRQASAGSAMLRVALCSCQLDISSVRESGG